MLKALKIERYGGVKGAEWGKVWGRCRKRIFSILFGHRTLLVDRKMRFLALFLICGIWLAGGGALAFGGGRAPSRVFTNPPQVQSGQ